MTIFWNYVHIPTREELQKHLDLVPKETIAAWSEKGVTLDNKILGLPIDYIGDISETAQQHIFNALSQNQAIRDLILSRWGVKSLRIYPQGTYPYKRVYRARVKLGNDTEETFDIDVYSFGYGIRPDREVALSESLASQIFNFPRSFDIEDSKKFLADLGFGKDMTYRGILDTFKTTFRQAIQEEAFHFQDEGSDSMVWADKRETYVIKSIVPSPDPNIPQAFHNYKVGRGKLGALAVKYDTLKPIEIYGNTEIVVYRRTESKGQITYYGRYRIGKDIKKVKVIRKETPEGISVEIVDEDGHEQKAFEFLRGRLTLSDPSDYGYDLLDVELRDVTEEDETRRVLFQKIKILQPVVQKFTPVLLKNDSEDPTGERLEGVLIDVMSFGQRRDIQYLLDQYFSLVQSVWRRGFFEYSFGWDNVSLDPSFGELGMVDIGKTVLIDEKTRHHMSFDQIPTYFSIAVRSSLKKALEQTQFSQATRILNYFDQGLREHLNIDPITQGWIEPEKISKLIGEYDEATGTYYFGPGVVRDQQLKNLANYIQGMISFRSLSEETLKQNLVQVNARNEKYFLDILGTLMPNVIGVRSFYEFSTAQDQDAVVRIFFTNGEENLEAVLEKQIFQSQVLTTGDLREIRKQIARIMINFYSYQGILYRYVAGLLGLDSTINPENPMELARSIDQLNQLPNKDLYEHLVNLLKLSLPKAPEEKETIESFKTKIRKSLTIAKHKRSFPYDLKVSDFALKRDQGGRLQVILRHLGPLLLAQRELTIYQRIQEITGFTLAEIAKAFEPALSQRGIFSFFEKIYFQSQRLPELQREIDAWQERGDSGRLKIVKVRRRNTTLVDIPKDPEPDEEEESQEDPTSGRSLGNELPIPNPLPKEWQKGSEDLIANSFLQRMGLAPNQFSKTISRLLGKRAYFVSPVEEPEKSHFLILDLASLGVDEDKLLKLTQLVGADGRILPFYQNAEDFQQFRKVQAGLPAPLKAKLLRSRQVKTMTAEVVHRLWQKPTLKDLPIGIVISDEKMLTGNFLEISSRMQKTIKVFEFEAKENHPAVIQSVYSLIFAALLDDISLLDLKSELSEKGFMLFKFELTHLAQKITAEWYRQKALELAA